MQSTRGEVLLLLNLAHLAVRRGDEAGQRVVLLLQLAELTAQLLAHALRLRRGLQQSDNANANANGVCVCVCVCVWSGPAIAMHATVPAIEATVPTWCSAGGASRVRRGRRAAAGRGAATPPWRLTQWTHTQGGAGRSPLHCIA